MQSRGIIIENKYDSSASTLDGKNMTAKLAYLESWFYPNLIPAVAEVIRLPGFDTSPGSKPLARDESNSIHDRRTSRMEIRALFPLLPRRSKGLCDYCSWVPRRSPATSSTKTMENSDITVRLPSLQAKNKKWSHGNRSLSQQHTAYFAPGDVLKVLSWRGKLVSLCML